MEMDRPPACYFTWPNRRATKFNGTKPFFARLWHLLSFAQEGLGWLGYMPDVIITPSATQIL